MRHDELLGLLHSLLARGEKPTFTWAAYWEFFFWFLVLLLTALLVWKRPPVLARFEASFRRFAAHRVASIVAVFVLAIVLRVAMLPWAPMPIPDPHDEFSYLVQADTFSHGSMANPVHPMWIFFETFHVNMTPAYQSMYPPAQGLAMAVGQRLTGEPWVGVLCSVALMCALFCWAMQGWMPPHWALLGGLFSAARYCTFSYYVNSYFGGAMAALGGALLVGALARLRNKFTARQALLFALGLVILANSRPLEGFLFCIPLGLSVLALMFASRLPRRTLLRTLVPALLLLAVAGSAMLYYNWRCTGHVTRMPYMINQDRYHISKPMIFQKPYPIPQYNHPEMRRFYVLHELPDVLRVRTRWGVEEILNTKVWVYYTFLVWPLLLVFLPAVVFSLLDREQRVLVFALLLMFAGLFLQIWLPHGHYAAPGTVAILIILFSGLRRLGASTQPPRYQYLARATILMLFLWIAVPLADRWNDPFSTAVDDDIYHDVIPRMVQRATIESRLMHTPGQHLVIVHYNDRDVPSHDWIYNAADIDASKVVWARDMGREKDKELLRYYANRTVWYAERGDGAVLRPYQQYMQLTHPADSLLTATAPAP